MSTIFTKIINREVPAYIVYEDDEVIAFLDITQATIGHTLVVSKIPYPDIFTLSDEISMKVFKVAADLAKAVKVAFNCDGVNILSNNGKSAGQTVFHFHLHVIPRYDNDNLKLSFNVFNETSTDEFKKRASLIMDALNLSLD